MNTRRSTSTNGMGHNSRPVWHLKKSHTSSPKYTTSLTLTTTSGTDHALTRDQRLGAVDDRHPVYNVLLGTCSSGSRLRTVWERRNTARVRSRFTRSRKTLRIIARRSTCSRSARTTIVFLPWLGVTGSTHLAPMRWQPEPQLLVVHGELLAALPRRRWEVSHSRKSSRTRPSGVDLRTMLGSLTSRRACDGVHEWPPLYQIAHHLFSDLRAIVAEISVRCGRCGEKLTCPYTSGSLGANTLSRLDDPQSRATRPTPQCHLSRRARDGIIVKFRVRDEC